MNLTENSHPAYILMAGSEEVEIAAGKSLKIETSSQGEEILDVVCPTGKKWSARVIVEIVETDV